MMASFIHVNASSAKVVQSSQGEISNDAHRASQIRRNCAWYMASWNLTALGDVDGLIEIARRFSCDVVSLMKER